jgi:hypothetical protein
MVFAYRLFFIVILIFSLSVISFGTEYYFYPEKGSDDNTGKTKTHPLQSLSALKNIDLLPGDVIYLAAGETFEESLILDGVQGSQTNPIIISSYQIGNHLKDPRAIIEAGHNSHGILLENCSYIVVKDLIVVGKEKDISLDLKMLCGVLVNSDNKGLNQNISLSNLWIKNIFINNKGFTRGKKEVRTPNGVQRYGWGIRFVNKKGSTLQNLKIDGCTIENVAHTGIKFTSNEQSIIDVKVYNNLVQTTGGPGIQLGRVRSGHIKNNIVDHSGSKDDSRKWGRGSGLWTWGCADILIENNHFLNANGPADSAGCHIDFNCNDVVVQYNFSYNNAGGFCEILGNNYNCAYRYNISVNDGHRVKGENGAFQEGKIFWLSGFVGKNNERKGPFNSYFYNNTIYTNPDLVAKFAVSKVAKGILITNNIFCISGIGEAVKGDQYVPEIEGAAEITDIFFKNNLFLHENIWPSGVWMKDEKMIVGDPKFVNAGGSEIIDFIALNTDLIKNKGIKVPKLEFDTIGLKIGLNPTEDILGNVIEGLPDLGAIEIVDKK